MVRRTSGGQHAASWRLPSGPHPSRPEAAAAVSAPDPAAVELEDLWADPWRSGLNSKLDRDMRFAAFAQDLGRKLRDVEAARWHLANLDHRKLGDARLVGYRALVSRLAADVAATCAELLESLPPEPDAGREKLVNRLLAQARGGE